MHGQGSCPSAPVNASLSPAGEDEAVQLALLTEVLSLHPAQLTVSELAREMSETPEDPGERDDVEQAVRDLAAAGLLHRNGAFVLPTRAALRFEELVQS